MTMPPWLRKAALTTHVTTSVGWLGAIAAFLVLAITGLASSDAQRIRAAYLAMDTVAWFAIVPLALAALLTGLTQSLATTWGLVRHYWVLVKLLVTVAATGVLLLQLDAIGYLADQAAQGTLSGSDLVEARRSLVVHAGGGLLVLLVPAVLSVYKPRGVTRYGRRKQQDALSRSRGSLEHI